MTKISSRNDGNFKLRSISVVYNESAVSCTSPKCCFLTVKSTLSSFVLDRNSMTLVCQFVSCVLCVNTYFAVLVSVAMSDVPDFNLNYEGLFGIGEDDEEVSAPELEDNCVDFGCTDDDAFSSSPCDESLTFIDFDPVQG